MQSISSSDNATELSGFQATEALASRYRHLFTLPSIKTILVFAIILSFALDYVVSKGEVSVATFLGVFLSLVIASHLVTVLAKSHDHLSIANQRRAMAALLVGVAIWFGLASVGLVYSLAFHSYSGLDNSVVYSAFVCVGAEFVIINGAFIKTTGLSLFSASIHPLLTASVFAISGMISVHSYVTIMLGLTSSAILILFILLLKRSKTSKGHNTIELFQAFLKAWADSHPQELETILKSHAEQTTVLTKVLRIDGMNGTSFIILPGVHPGPFYPVGSFNLPGELYYRFSNTGLVLTFHRPGGHERNLATASDTKAYIEELFNFATSIKSSKVPLRGPKVVKIGEATASILGLGNDALLTISFAPRGSDDLEAAIEEKLSAVSGAHGFSLSVVDAHNSIASDRVKFDIFGEEWDNLFINLRGEIPEVLRAGFAHSSELGVDHYDDLTVGGVAVIEFESKQSKWVLALADANNATPALRAKVESELMANGFNLIEFCTTDSHNLAAKGLTVARGYLALGEATPIDEISLATVKLAKLAATRMSECKYGSGVLLSKVDTFGQKALSEFATLTQSNSRFAKNYAKFAITAILTLLIASFLL